MDNLTGKQIGQYEIESMVGQGASGVVYKARQGQRPFALKIIHPNLAQQPSFRQELLELTDTLTNMGHQGIARVHTISEDGGHLYVASEWVPGETLGQLMQHSSGVSLAVMGQLAIQITETLIFTHRQGAVHGGIHPNNILLKPIGGTLPWQPILTDFRLTSLIPGTPSASLRPYLAPEQLSRSRVDARSDIFALGVVLYQLTTGQLPATGQTIPPHTLRPDMPPAFGNVILQAVAPTVRDRFRSMEELATALRREAGQLPHTVPAAASAAPAPAPTPAPPVPSASKNALLITHPDEKPRQFPLGQKWLITIGQMDGNDLVLPAEGVSAKHARLERKEDAHWVIVDMNSRRGTLLENSRLLPDVPQEWRPGQEVQIGPYTLAWGDGRSLPTAEPIETYTPPEPPKPPPPPPAAPKLTITLNQPQVVVQPGEPSQGLVLDLQNGPNEVSSIRLKAVQIPADWVALEAGTIHLLPRQKVRVPLVIQPPRHHSARAGQHSYQIRAESVNGGETAVCQGQVTVLPFSRFQAETQPPSLKHGRQGKVVVTNEGNAAQGYTVTAQDVAQSLEFNLPQSQVQAAPGETQSLPITVKAKRPFTLKTKVSPFELQVREGERAIAVNGRVILSPIIVWPLILLGLLVLAAAIWGGRTYICNREDVRLLANSRFNPEAQNIRFCGEYVNVPTATAVPIVETAVTPAIEEATEAAPAEGTTTVPTEEETAAAETPPTNTPPPPTAVPVEPEQLVIGQSVNGVDIVAYAFGEGTDAVIFVGGIHYGYAPASKSLADQVITYFQNNPEAVAAIPANIKVFIVPNMNPDSIPSPGTVGARVNANGVNLNSNWPCNWGTANQPGNGPLSEPESKAVYDFIAAQNAVATIFWNTPVNDNNQRAVSPGRCTLDQTAVSADLMNTYADAIPGYNAQQADPNQRFSGDATDSIAEINIPSIFVLLDSASEADVTQHLPAIQAVLQAHSN